MRRVYVATYIQTYIHTCMHACIHTDINLEPVYVARCVRHLSRSTLYETKTHA